MRKTKIGFLVLTFLFCNSLSAQWINQNSNTTQDLNSVAFVNEFTGFAVGNNGTVRKTTNSGQSWMTVNTGISLSLNKVHIVNGNVLYIVGFSSILKSTNLGITWTMQSASPSTTYNSIHFINDQTGYIVGDNGVILRTSNAGTNWQSISTPTSNRLNDVTFINDNTGFAVGISRTNLRTTNGGFTWTAISMPVTSQGILLSVAFANESNGIIIKNNDNNSREIFRTTNGGNNWFTLDLITVNSFRQVQFVDENNGIIIGDQGNYFRTFDGGINWFQLPTNTLEWLYSVCFVNPDVGWAVGRNGKIIFTLNGAGGIPNAPTNLSGFVTSPNTIFLSWDDNSFNETGFKIERADSSSNNFFEIATVGTNISFYFDNQGLVTGKTYKYKVAAFNMSGTSAYSNVFEITLVNIDPISSIVPEKFNLYNNYPNPFNPETKIKFDVPKSTHVMIEIFNVKGELISELVNSKLNPGQYEVTFNSSGLSGGIFFYRMISGDFAKTGKMVLLK